MDATLLQHLADTGYEVTFARGDGDTSERRYQCVLASPEGDVTSALGETAEAALAALFPLAGGAAL